MGLANGITDLLGPIIADMALRKLHLEDFFLGQVVGGGLASDGVRISPPLAFPCYGGDFAEGHESLRV